MKDVAPIFVVFALLVLWLVGLLRRWKWACDWTPHGKLWMFDKCSDETRRRIQIVVAVLGMVGCVAMMPWRLKEGAEVAVDENEALFDRIARTVTNGDGSRPENVDSVLVAELAAIRSFVCFSVGGWMSLRADSIDCQPCFHQNIIPHRRFGWIRHAACPR